MPLFIKKNKLIFLILCVAFLVRVIGIFPGHNGWHPDEPMSYGSAVDMFRNNNLHPGRFDYPSGVSLINYFVYQTIPVPLMKASLFLNNPSSFLDQFDPSFYRIYSQKIFGHRDYYALFWSRYITAILGTFTVFFVYIIGKKLFNSYVGIFSAIFLTFNYRHALSSHLALSDIPNSFFALLTFYGCILLFEKNSHKRYILCGILVGLSFAIKYQVFAVFPFLFVHLYWVVKKKNFYELFNPYFILSLILIPITFAVLNPYFFLNLQTALSTLDMVSRRYGAGINRINPYPVFYLYKWGIGQFPFFVILVGFVSAFAFQRVRSLLLFSYIVPFLYIFLYYMLGGSYIRNFTTIIPFFTLFAGVSCYYLFYFFRYFLKLNKKTSFIVIGLILFVINLSSLQNSIVLAINYTKPWNRDVLSSWAQQKLPSNVRVRNDNLGVHVQEKEMVDLKWSHSEENSISEFQEEKTDFAVLNVDYHQAYMFWFDLSSKKLLTYQDIPYELLKDSYYGLALSEFLNYSVKEIYKPWQSPDDNYIVVKIPHLPKEYSKQIASYDFNSSASKWKEKDFKLIKEKNVEHVIVGNNESGSIRIGSKSAITSLSRIVSPRIPVREGKTYILEASVKPEVAIDKARRDSFFRIDVYDKSNNVQRHAVSGRIYGNSLWQKKVVAIQTAPEAKYLTVSFQRERPEFGFDYLIDDVSIYEAENQKEPFSELAYIKPTIPKETLYPNSIY